MPGASAYLSEAAAAMASMQQMDDEIDTLEAATAWGVSRARAQNMLAADVASGKLTTRLAKRGNAWVRVWRPTGK